MGTQEPEILLRGCDALESLTLFVECKRAWTAPDLTGCPNLESLVFHRWSAQGDPILAWPDLSFTPHLKLLEVNTRNATFIIPDFAQQVPELTTFKLTDWKGDQLPELVNLKQLKTLSLLRVDCPLLPELPANLEHLNVWRGTFTNLNTLAGRRFESIDFGWMPNSPEWDAKNLKVLNQMQVDDQIIFRGLKFPGAFPSNLLGPSLDTLSMNDCSLSSLPDLARTPQLKTLILEKNRIDLRDWDLPESLVELTLNNCSECRLPDILELPNLEQLNIRNCKRLNPFHVKSKALKKIRFHDITLNHEVQLLDARGAFIEIKNSNGLTVKAVP